jgi:Nuclease-related domain/AAA domain/UvrD-like helicase C-terminal domain
MPPRLIPPTIPLTTPSEGERVVFAAFADAKGADDWIVLHSLDLANHQRRLAGEIDFLVIVPGKGVLVLEVKGTHHLRRHDGLWFYGSDQRPDERGPFKQASEAMHSLRERLVRQHRDLARVVFWSAVCLPFVDFDETSEEWHPWQVIDRRALAKRTLTQLCESVLDHARRELVAHEEPWFHAERHEPRGQQVTELLRNLRGDFEFFESPKSRAQRVDDEVRRYTEEQFEALETIDANPRVIFDGPAGTGKTMLAVEAARRGAVAGRRVLLLCVNRALGRWLADETRELLPLDAAGTPSQGAPDSAAPAAGIVARTIDEHLRRAGEATEHYDEIVVDEAQDMLRPDYLKALDLSLKGGLAGGVYRFFGDFGRPDPSDSAGDDGATALAALLGPGGPCAGAVRYDLRVNCRNTPRVAQLACTCGGVTRGYRRVRRPDDEFEPQIRYWRDEAQQTKLLADALLELDEQGFGGRRTVVLSPRDDDRCCAHGLAGHPWAERLAPLLGVGATADLDVVELHPSATRYCAISRFQGLEAPAVVLTDIADLDSSAACSALYVGCTRALERLVILAHESLKAKLEPVV